MAHRAQAPWTATRRAASLLIGSGIAMVLLPLLFPDGRAALRNSDLVVGVLLAGLGAHCLYHAMRGAPVQSFGAAVMALVLSAWVVASPFLLRVAPGPVFMGTVLLGLLAFLVSLQVAMAGVRLPGASGGHLRV